MLRHDGGQQTLAPASHTNSFLSRCLLTLALLQQAHSALQVPPPQRLLDLARQGAAVAQLRAVPAAALLRLL